MTAAARGPSRAVFALACAAVIGALGVALLRPSLASSVHRIKTRDDVYALPPPEELKLATLGYRSAAVDLLWATLLVENGRHWSEKRPFPDLEKYIDAILALEPGFPTLYAYVDTLLVFRPILGTEEDARKARAYLEQGLREHPTDHRLWLQYGQFVGFLAPSFLSSSEDKEAWRVLGSEAILRAAELGASVDRSLSATAILSRAGRRKTALEYLERAQALTEDPVTVAEIGARLARLEREMGQSDKEEPEARRILRQRRESRARYIDGRWQAELPFISRGEFLLLGPVPDPLTCTVAARQTRPECARSWSRALGVAER